MNNTTTISVEDCCLYYQIESTFILQLDEHGLIALERSGQQLLVAHEQLADLEKYMHLHYELDINMEGMQAIKHLLYRIEDLQEKLKKLENELGRR